MLARSPLMNLLTLILTLSATFAVQQVAAPQAAAQEGAATAAPPEPKEFVTAHKIEIGGKSLAYSAIASETLLRGDDGQAEASIFSIGYHLDGVEDPAKRPITFLFNGGPGSSAVWLHLGAFGPRQLDLGRDPLDAGGPPYKLRDNRHSPFDVTDLVFVDPVGTGYSRALGDGNDSDYWGVDEDSAAMAAFIRKYLARHGRWNSPKYMAAESYGTIRASLVLRDLQLDPLEGVPFNGVILISAALDVRIFMIGIPGNDLAYVTALPTYAATAYYHDQLPEKPADLEAFLDEVREFASTEYLMALFEGDSLPEERQASLATKLHRYTGISEEYYRRANLRVGARRFVKELLRGRGETLAIHDTRFRGQDPDDAGETVAWDPFLTAISGPFTTSINSYLAGELEVSGMEDGYEVFVPVGSTWKRGQNDRFVFSGFLHTTPNVAQCAATNRDFRVFVASGYHDLTTTFFGVEHTFDHSGIDKERITLRNYFGGHMMYLYEPSLEALAKDVRDFIAAGAR